MMKSSLRAEWRKLTSVRSFWVLATAVVAYPLLTTVLAATTVDPDSLDVGPALVPQLARGGADVAAFVALIVGILTVGWEYRHGTVVSSLLAQPRRLRFIGAKLVASGVVGGALAAASLVVSVVAGGVYLVSLGVDVFDRSIADLALAAVGIVAVGVLYGTIGAAVGAVVRNQTVAIAGAFLWLLAVENAIPIVLRNPELRDWTLGGASGRLFHLVDPVAGMPSAWAAAGLLVAVAAVVGVAGLAVTTRSEVASA